MATAPEPSGYARLLRRRCIRDAGVDSVANRRTSRFAATWGTLLALTLTSCSQSDRPEATFEAFSRAVKAQDTAGFARLFTERSTQRLEKSELELTRAGDLPRSARFVEFAVQRLNAATPFDGIEFQKDGNDAVATFRARGNKRGKVKLRREDGTWKIDVTDAVDEWQRLRMWALEANDVLGGGRGTPPIGTFGGIEVQSDLREGLLIGEEVPGMLWDEEVEPAK